MPTRSSKLGVNQLAKRSLDEVTGVESKTEPSSMKNEAAVALSRLGGKYGGVVPAAKLTAEHRSETVNKTAAGRWRNA